MDKQYHRDFIILKERQPPFLIVDLSNAWREQYAPQYGGYKDQ